MLYKSTTPPRFEACRGTVWITSEKVGELSSNMPFVDYRLQWIDIVRVRMKPTTYGSYETIVKNSIEPYFCPRGLSLRELEARYIQPFYSEKLKTVKPNSVIHYAVRHQALKYALKALRRLSLGGVHAGKNASVQGKRKIDPNRPKSGFRAKLRNIGNTQRCTDYFII